MKKFLVLLCIILSQYVLYGVQGQIDSGLTYIPKVYHKEQNKVFYGESELTEADYNTFTQLNETYAKDKQSIFHKQRKIDVDYQTFQVFDKAHTKDKNNAYYLTKEIKDVDLTSFKALNSRYAVDKNYLYDYGAKLEGINPQGLIAVDDFYVRNDKEMYGIDYRIIYESIPNTAVDFSTFKHFYLNVYADKNGLYYVNYDKKLVKIENSTSEGLEKLDLHLIRDKNYLYYIVNKYAHHGDYDYIYHGVQQIDFVDFKSFEKISPTYFKDKNTVYFMYDKVYPILGSDPNTFEIKNFYFAKDKNAEYEIVLANEKSDTIFSTSSYTKIHSLFLINKDYPINDITHFVWRKDLIQMLNKENNHFFRDGVVYYLDEKYKTSTEFNIKNIYIGKLTHHMFNMNGVLTTTIYRYNKQKDIVEKYGSATYFSEEYFESIPEKKQLSVLYYDDGEQILSHQLSFGSSLDTYYGYGYFRNRNSIYHFTKNIGTKMQNISFEDLEAIDENYVKNKVGKYKRDGNKFILIEKFPVKK